MAKIKVLPAYLRRRYILIARASFASAVLEASLQTYES